MKKKARILVAANLRSIRAKYDYSIEYVAEKSGVNKDTISRYENATVSQQIDLLEKLLNVYDMDLAIFFANIYANTHNKQIDS